MKQILALTRMNMSSAIAFSAVAGYIFFTGNFEWNVVAVYTGVLLLACSATVLNQIQERHQDAMMSRTKDRPLASNKIKLFEAIVITVLTGVSGILILYYLTNPLTALLGLFNIFWYNAIYTPLKKLTGFVVIVGAITGAIPPVMGWTAAGGNLADSRIIFIAMFFFLWQIPHFLLLLLRHKEDYQKVGFKSVTSEMNDNQIQMIVFAWILGTSLITLLFPVFRIISGKFLIAGIVVLNVLLITFFYRNVFRKNLTFNLGKAFGSLYLYQLSVLAILILQALK